MRNSDALLDEPSFRAIEGILNDYARMQRESEELREELKETLVFNSKQAEEWTRQETAIGDIVAHGSGSTLAVGVPA